MTKEEAIKIIEVIKGEAEWEYPLDWQLALDMAIEDLNANKCVETQTDLIRRQDAIDALGEEPEIWNDSEEEWAYRNAWVEHISAIKSLPSAEPNLKPNLQPTCNQLATMDGDLISRQAAVDAARQEWMKQQSIEFMKGYIDGNNDAVEGVISKIESLPSAEPKTKCIAQIRIDRDDMEDLINEKVNEIVDKMAGPKEKKNLDRR